MALSVTLIAINTRANSAGTTIAATVPVAGVALNHDVAVFVLAGTTTLTGWSCADTKLNSYAADFTITALPSSGGACAVFHAKVTTALVSGNTITVTTPSVSWAAIVAVDMGGWVGSAKDLSLAATGTSTAPASGTTGASVFANEIIFGVVFANLGPASGDSVTETITGPTAGYTAITPANANGGNSTSARTMVVFPYFKIVSATGTQAFGATLGHTDTWVCLTLSYAGWTTNSRTVSQLAALLSTQNRTVPQSAALKALGLQHTIPEAAALAKLGISKTIPEAAVLKATTSKSIPESAVLKATNTRTILESAALKSIGNTRVLGESAALKSVNNQKSISQGIVLLAPKNQRTISQAGVLKALGQQRQVPSSALLQALGIGKVIPQSAVLKSFANTRTVLQRALLGGADSGTFLRTIPQYAILLEELQKQVPQSASLLEPGISRVVPEAAALKALGLAKSIPQLAALRTSGVVKSLPQSALFGYSFLKVISQQASFLGRGFVAIPQSAVLSVPPPVFVAGAWRAVSISPTWNAFPLELLWNVLPDENWSAKPAGNIAVWRLSNQSVQDIAIKITANVNGAVFDPTVGVPSVAILPEGSTQVPTNWQSATWDVGNPLGFVCTTSVDATALSIGDHRVFVRIVIGSQSIVLLVGQLTVYFL